MNTPERSRQKRSVSKRATRVAVLGLLAAGATGAIATSPAFAAGTSDTVGNCYTQWWNTAWAQKCPAPGAKWTETYESGITCSAQGGRTLTVGRAKGSTSTVNGSDCTFSASNGWITVY
ncbi:hypothetical protein [Micromonospora zhanjiangensis]|uniref:Alpha amylase inhibitor n=1 Tax=Micromonospora zhanjiangensis TaxID=1522057 RepID=A0ABV8KGT6_9ACTN